MPKGYHHLTRDQRCQLAALKDSGESIDDIAMQLNTHRSTLYRELSRNQGETGYEYQQAHAKATERMTNVGENALKMTFAMIAIIESKLKLQWSPEQIAGWLKRRDAGQNDLSGPQAKVTGEGPDKSLGGRCLEGLEKLFFFIWLGVKMIEIH